VSSIGYTASGQVSSIAYANGVSTTYAYDPKRLWMNSFSHARAGTVYLA
jgi:hypothetical protein